MKEISLKGVYGLFIKNIIWILIGTVTGLISMYMISRYIIKPKYASEVLLYVDSTSEQTEYVNKSEIDTSRSLVDTYIVFLMSEDLLEKVASNLGGNISGSEVKSYVSMGSVNNTEVLRIQAKSYDAELSNEICNVFADEGPKKIKEHIKGGDVTIISRPVVAAGPSSPNVSLNTLFGAMLGFAISMGLILLKTHLDNTVKSEEDIREIFGLNSLGEIPEIASGRG